METFEVRYLDLIERLMLLNIILDMHAVRP
jgi:hypothetical protein